MALDLARWQFAFTSVNHFLFIPITIGLAFLTALLQTAWYRSGRDEYLRLTRFFGTLLVINVAGGSRRSPSRRCWPSPSGRTSPQAARSDLGVLRVPAAGEPGSVCARDSARRPWRPFA
jgi:hypothetical protein